MRRLQFERLQYNRPMRRLERRASFLQRSGNRFRDATQYAPTKWLLPTQIRVISETLGLRASHNQPTRGTFWSNENVLQYRPFFGAHGLEPRDADLKISRVRVQKLRILAIN
jgi:hypothetical protein